MKQNVGLGLRHTFHNYVLENKPAVPWFEVITENYLYFDGSPRSFLHKIRELYPLVFHGVSLSIGSLEPVRKDYLLQLKKLIQEFQPLWLSDHLCWTYNGTENSHDLLPVPFTQDSLKRIIAKTQQAQEILGQKIYLENPSAYVDFAANEYSEEDFISELCKKSGCGLLLDLNNLVVNQYNLGYKPQHYLETIKNCDVRQIHLAGHTIKEKVRIDTHDSDISQEVLDLIPLAKQQWPEACPMIEWDDKIPEIEYLLNQREQIEKRWQQPRVQASVETLQPAIELRTFTLPLNPTPTTENKTHQTFWSLLKKNDYITPAETADANLFKSECPTPAHVGINVYSSAYYNRLLEVLEIDFPVLKAVLHELFSDVALQYLKIYPSVYDTIDFIGNNLARFIAEHKFDFSLGVDQKIISDIAAFENLSSLSSVIFMENHKTLSVKALSEEDWSNKKIKRKADVLIYKAYCEIAPVIKAVQKNETPEIPDLKTTCYAFYRENNVSFFKQISSAEFDLLHAFSEFKCFVDILDESASDLTEKAQLLFQNEKFLCVEM